MSIEEDKVRARREARSRRLEAHRLGKAGASDQAAGHFLAWAARIEGRAEAIIAGYWPAGSEFDLRPLLFRLHAEGFQEALPVEATGGVLRFRRWRPDDPLEPGPHGILEPTAAAHEVRPDVVLVPLLAFDHQGGRLGQGGGHYDRTLAALRETGRLVAVGAGYALQRMDRVPRSGHDQCLDWILTEEGIERAT